MNEQLTTCPAAESERERKKTFWNEIAGGQRLVGGGRGGWMDEGFIVASEKLLQVREQADEMDVWNTPDDLVGLSAALKGLIPRKKSDNVKIQEEEGVKAQVMVDRVGVLWRCDTFDLRQLLKELF